MENQNSDFYIGWQSHAPDQFRKRTKRFVVIITALISMIAVVLVVAQKPFSTGTFELGKFTEIEGTLFLTPVPMIKTNDTQSGMKKSVLLIGFGKSGAEYAFEDYLSENKHLVHLNGAKARLEGTLIYDRDKTLLELTNGKASILDLGVGTNYQIKKESLGFQTLRGEIYDPKCAFGVMKPGYGKIHRSCAVRCIAGGIPAVLKLENDAGEKNYALILDSQGKPVNEALLPYVADQIQICGQLERQDDWLVLYTEPREQLTRLHPYWAKGDLAMCSE